MPVSYWRLTLAVVPAADDRVTDTGFGSPINPVTGSPETVKAPARPTGTRYEPSGAVVADAILVPLESLTTIVAPATARGAHPEAGGLCSTGHTGPAVTVPVIDEGGPGTGGVGPPEDPGPAQATANDRRTPRPAARANRAARVRLAARASRGRRHAGLMAR
jgi:hypothetical protein